MEAETSCWTDDVGELLIRLSVGGFMLFPGVHKALTGIDWMYPLLEARGLPNAMAYGSYVGEIVAPVLMLMGILTRISGLIVAGTMGMAVYLALVDKVFTINEHGGWALELNGLFFLGALGLVFMGPGRVSLSRGRRWWA